MKQLLLFFALLTISLCTNAQNYKYGKVSDAEIDMEIYPADSSASAVMLSKIGSTEFQVVDNYFEIYSTTEVRVKILREQGVSYADVEIPFYSDGGRISEKVNAIDAVAYNRVGGKVEKSKLPIKYIFTEKRSGNWSVVKFTVPSVKVGTVIEYKYTIASDYVWRIAPWIIQQNIPVAYAKYDLYIPKWYRFGHSTKGYEPIVRTKTLQERNVVITLRGKTEGTTLPYEVYTFTSKNVPALKKEPYLWSNEDFRSGVDFELQGLAWPDQAYRDLGQTWGKLKKSLVDYSKFGGALKLRNPLSAQMKMLNLDSLTIDVKMRKLFKLLKNNIGWNGEYELFATNPGKALEDKLGSNADINFIYLSMLREAGIKASPILVRTRSKGRMPLTRTSINDITTFIVGGVSDDGELYLVDGSITLGDVNLLPDELLVERGLYFDADQTTPIDLATIGNHSKTTTFITNIAADGVMSGKRSTVYQGLKAVEHKKALLSAEDSVKFIENTEKSDDIKINSVAITGARGIGSVLQEEVEFTKQLETTDEYIYLNPLVIAQYANNPFTQSERKFPIEYNYAQTIRINCVITIPDGYAIEHLPSPIKAAIESGLLSFTYLSQGAGNIIQARYTFTIKHPVIATAEYKGLQAFWSELVSKSNEQIVLKKLQ